MKLVEKMAAAETGPARRAFLEQFPEGFGLVGERPEHGAARAER
ncbi:hypothetical protein ABZS59_07600 [Streptomyces flaveolus]